MPAKIEVDVYGNWSEDPPIYRIFINNEMLIERTFGWSSNQNYVTEHLYCELDTGVHTLRCDNLNENSRIELKHLRVNDNLINTHFLRTRDTMIEWRFVIDNLLKHSQSVVSHVLDKEILDPPPPPVEIIPEKPKGVVQPKKYETYIPLVQRARQLNARK